MTLLLDERRRAMLAEFGIELPPQRLPQDEPAQPTASQQVCAPVTPPAPVAVPLPVPAVRPLSVEPGSRPTGVEAMDWDTLAQTVAECRACKLCASRRNTVFGVGDQQADWLIVGEAPGENEDLQGEPFVGQAGKLLDNMLRAVGLARGRKVYIANVLKCRPPGNRNPEPDEVAQCEQFLRRQVQLLQPRIILAMGRFAVQSLLGSSEAIGRLRGQRHAYQGVPVVVTYHPAYLLRNLPDKAKAWADLCLAAEIANAQA